LVQLQKFRLQVIKFSLAADNLIELEGRFPAFCTSSTIPKRRVLFAFSGGQKPVRQTIEREK
jgi:hypothetical protein